MNNFILKIKNFFFRLLSFLIISKRKRSSFRAKHEYIKGAKENYIFLVHSDGTKERIYHTINGLKIDFKDYKNNTIEVHDDASFGFCPVVFIGNNSKLTIGKGFTANSVTFYLTESNSSISVGDECMFSYEVLILSGDAHSICLKGENMPYNKPEPVIIGNHVWLGYNSKISKGTVIPDNSIVGLASVVSGKFNEENVIIAGNPAKIIKRGIEWHRNAPEAMLNN